MSAAANRISSFLAQGLYRRSARFQNRDTDLFPPQSDAFVAYDLGEVVSINTMTIWATQST